MKKLSGIFFRVMTLFRVIILCAVPILFSQTVSSQLVEDSWPVCEDHSAAGRCQPQQKTAREYNFNLASFEQGLSYLKEHPVPLSILIPSEFWYDRFDNNLVSGYSLTERETLDGLVKAQVALADWLKEAIAGGYQKPRITWKLLVKINQLITGDYTDFESETFRNYNLPVVTRLPIEYITVDVIDELIHEVNELRKSARIELADDWGYGIKTLVKKGNREKFEEELLSLKPKSVRAAFRRRAEFLNKYLSTAEGRIFGIIRTERGGYSTSQSAPLYYLDSARFYHLGKKIVSQADREYKTHPIRISCQMALSNAFDVPGELFADNAHADQQCEGFWPTFIPSGSSEDLTSFGGIYLYTATHFVERKAMFDVALSSLNVRLKPVMTRTELMNVIAESWRQLALAHVFPDGNGRTLRLLANSLFMAYGLPPLACYPDCLPYSHTAAYFKEDIRAAMTLTRLPMKADQYPEWLAEPQQPEWLEMINGL